MRDLENDNWIILDPLGNIYEIYANLTVMTLLNLNHFWITQAELYLNIALVKASIMFATFFRCFWKSWGKNLLTLPVPNVLKLQYFNWSKKWYNFHTSLWCPNKVSSFWVTKSVEIKNLSHSPLFWIGTIRVKTVFLPNSRIMRFTSP